MIGPNLFAMDLFDRISVVWACGAWAPFITYIQSIEISLANENEWASASEPEEEEKSKTDWENRKFK